MKKLVVAILCVLPLSAFSQTNVPVVTDTNKTTLLNGPTSIPATTNRTVNAVKLALDATFQWVDVGSTWTVSFEKGATTLKPSFTVMGKPGIKGTWKNILNTTFEADVELGPVMSYVPAWDEYDAGVGVSLNLFRLPPKLTLAQDSTPVVDTLTPKLSLVKAFAGAEVKLNNVTHEQIGRIVFGVTVPL